MRRQAVITELEPSRSGAMYAKQQRELCALVREINEAWRATGRTGSPIQELLITLAKMLAWAEDT
jgi:hypothetical protein